MEQPEKKRQPIIVLQIFLLALVSSSFIVLSSVSPINMLLQQFGNQELPNRVEPLRMSSDRANGIYIGRHVNYLPETHLFEVLVDKWDKDRIPSAIADKMVSGEFSSDTEVDVIRRTTSGKYQAEMKLNERPQAEVILEWGLEDLERADIKWSFNPEHTNVFNLNLGKHAYWLRFQIINESKMPFNLLIELDKYLYRQLDYIEQTDNGIEIRPAYLLSNLNERPIQYKHIIHELAVKPGLNTYYFRTENFTPDSVPLRLWSVDHFSKHLIIDNTANGILIGIFVLVFLYNLFIYQSVADKSFILLSMMTIAALFSHLCISGIGFQLLWQENPMFGVSIFYFVMPMNLVLFLAFSRAFINIPKLTPKTDKLLLGMIALFLLTMFLIFVLPTEQRTKITAILLKVDYFYFLPVLWPVFISIGRGNRSGWYLLIGIIFYIISNLEWELSSIDIIPYHLINYLHFKGASFFLIMTLGLANKINSMKKRLTDLNINLENKVIERTNKLSKTTNELKEANRKLQELDQLKTRFFTNVSHELRTPLTLISAPVSAFLKGDYGKLSKEKQTVLTSIQKNADRLLKLINNLLDYAKIEAGRLSISITNCNIVDMLSYCISSVESTATAKGIDIQFEDRTGGLTAQVDWDLMEKAIFNLLSNAIKFNRPGGRIRVVLVIENEQMSIIIKDTGIGIPTEKLESIFNRFNQIDDSSTRKHEGTGIGLSLTREIVRLHSGKIHACSDLGQGSSFTIQIPIIFTNWDDASIIADQNISGPQPFQPNQLRPMPEYGRPEVQTPGSGNIAIDTGRRKSQHKENTEAILIVEDNMDMCNFLVSILGKDYRIFTAGNGKEALSRLEQEEIDLVLADIMMPEMDGYELTQAIREDEQYMDLPIILLTAKSETHNIIDGIDKGANEYLTKPFSPDELSTRIRSQLNFRKLRQKIFDAKLKLLKTKKTITETTKIKIESVKAVLNDNYYDLDITRDSLAQAVNMSPDHLGRTFKEYTGERISDYLNRLRVNAATSELEETEKKIIDIAFDVGFGSLRSFNKTFLESKGVSPSQYRKNFTTQNLTPDQAAPSRPPL